MTISIGPDDEREDIKRRVGRSVDRHELRNSDARRRRLQSNSRRQARTWDLTLEIDDSLPTAHIMKSPDAPPHVVITGRQIDQTTTDYDPEAWDWIAQQSFGVHEVGHERYSDIPHKDQLMGELDRADKGVAHSLWNAAEDGAIEQQITRRWEHFYPKLRALRANLFLQEPAGIEDPERGGHVYPVAHAAQAAILDMWMQEVYSVDPGVLKGLLDPQNDEYHFATEDDRELFVSEIMFHCRAMVKIALNNGKAKTRNDKFFAVIWKILELLDDADSDGRAQKKGEKGQGDDGTGMPDDSRENHSGDAVADAEQLEREEDAEPSAGGEAAENGEEARSARPEDLTDIDDVEVDEDLAEEAREISNADSIIEAGVGEDLLDEIEEMQSAMKSAADTALRSQQLDIPTGRTRDDDVVRRGRAAADRLAQVLENRLQSQRRSETVRNQPRGAIDERALHRTALGSTDVRKRTIEPDEKDYSAALVLDRSGSMSGGDVFAGATASLMWLLALEQVGVDTMMVDLYNSDVHLAKPFNVSVEQSMDRIASTAATSGTPLTQVLALTRERLMQERGEKFMVVVTDGAPSSVENFEAELQRCPFPVVGVTIGTSSTGEGVYHRTVNVTDADQIQDALERLLHEVMF